MPVDPFSTGIKVFLCACGTEHRAHVWEPEQELYTCLVCYRKFSYPKLPAVCWLPGTCGHTVQVAKFGLPSSWMR